MDFNNLTPFASQYWFVLDKEGKKRGALTVKAVFEFVREEGWHLKLKQQQAPLVAEAVYYGEQNVSPVRYDTEYTPKKPVTDVILNATGYAPDGFNTRWRSGIQVGDNKPVIVEITGHRVWQKTRTGLKAGEPEECESVPVRYDFAFGGVLLREGSENLPLSPDTILAESPCNPVGCGLTHKDHPCDGLRYPQLLWPGTLLTPYDDSPPSPAGFGHIGRGWQPRIGLAGTYDSVWLNGQHPLLPMDFSDYFHNEANPRLQMAGYLKGDEPVTLLNLDPYCEVLSFTLPGLRVMWQVKLKSGVTVTGIVPLDTLFLDIETGLAEGEASLCWRADWPSGEEVTALTVMALPAKEEKQHG